MKTNKMLPGRLVNAVLTVLLLLVFTGCYTVPVTGRRSFILIDEGTELRMGLQAFDQIKSETPISTDAEINAMVQRVGTRIAAVTNRPDYDWEFVVFDKPDVQNAFALPGGKVGVFTGILDVTETEEGLAVVMAHEVAHAMAKHGAERFSEGLLLMAGAVILDEATRKSNEREAFFAAYGIGASLFVALPHSRKQEAEADHIGLIYMARAGYDPREGPELWQRFADFKDEKGGMKVPELISTHPADETRIRNLRALLPEALPHYYEATGQVDKLATYQQPQVEPSSREILTAPIKTRKARRDKAAYKFSAVPVEQAYILKCPVCGKNNKVSSNDGYQRGTTVKCYNCRSSFK